MAIIKLNPERGNLPTWAQQQAERLSDMKVFQAKATGFRKSNRTACLNGLRRQLEEVGITGRHQYQVVDDILDLVRLKVNADEQD